MSRTRLIFSILALALCYASAAQAGTDEEAKVRFLEGKRSYAAGRYADAIKSFKAAGAIRPSPILEFNIGRCHHNLGQINEAIASYKRYLEAAKDAPNRTQILAWIAELEQKRGDVKDPYQEADEAWAPSSGPATAAPKSQPAAPPGPVHEALLPETWSARAEAPAAARPARGAPGPRPTPAPSKPSEGPLYKQWWFWVGCAGAALITGFIIYTATSSRSSTPPPQTTTRGLVVHF